VLSAHGVRFEDLSEQQRTEALDALKGISTNPEPKKKSAKPKNETVIDLSNLSLAQKGYPAPVAENIGRR
jgi:hypothetical protein